MTVVAGEGVSTEPRRRRVCAKDMEEDAQEQRRRKLEAGRAKVGGRPAAPAASARGPAGRIARLPAAGAVRPQHLPGVALPASPWETASWPPPS